jgi:cytochrome P450
LVTHKVYNVSLPGTRIESRHLPISSPVSHTFSFSLNGVTGTPFLYWFGPQPRVFVSDYKSVRQILSNKSGHFLKNDAHPTILSVLGKGLVLVEGADWVRHRRVVNPAFAMDKLKVIAKLLDSQLGSRPH